MANTRENPGDRAVRVEKDSVAARQGFRDRPILLVLIASLVLVIAAYLIVAVIVPA